MRWCGGREESGESVWWGVSVGVWEDLAASRRMCDTLCGVVIVM